MRFGERGNLFLGQVAFVGTTVVELVAIGLGVDAAEDGTELGQVDLADTGELVEDLLLFELQLFLVG